VYTTSYGTVRGGGHGVDHQHRHHHECHRVAELEQQLAEQKLRQKLAASNAEVERLRALEWVRRQADAEKEALLSRVRAAQAAQPRMYKYECYGVGGFVFLLLWYLAIAAGFAVGVWLLVKGATQDDEWQAFNISMGIWAVVCTPCLWCASVGQCNWNRAPISCTDVYCGVCREMCCPRC